MYSRVPELRDVIARLAAGHPDPHRVDPHLKVLSTTQTTRPLNTFAEPSVAMVVQGAKRAIFGDRAFDYGPGQFFVVTVEVPLTSWITVASDEAPFLAVGITLDPTVIAELLLDLPPEPADATTNCLGVFDASPALLDAVLRRLQLADSAADRRVLAHAVTREIHWRLLNGPQGPLIRNVGRPDSSVAAVARASSWLRTNVERPYRATELASAVGLSVSSVNRYFRRATALSPLQYQKQLRLHAARLQLVSGQHDVASVGHGVGYSSASQFAREYKRFFGRSPRDEARGIASGSDDLVAGEFRRRER